MLQTNIDLGGLNLSCSPVQHVITPVHLSLAVCLYVRLSGCLPFRVVSLFFCVVCPYMLLSLFWSVCPAVTLEVPIFVNLYIVPSVYSVMSVLHTLSLTIMFVMCAASFSFLYSFLFVLSVLFAGLRGGVGLCACLSQTIVC